jgi:GNAT superfamily N-acetyltransferase
MAVETETIPGTTMQAAQKTPHATVASVSPVEEAAAMMPNLVANTSRLTMTTTSSSISPAPLRVLKTADYKGAAACLATAFASDPVCTYGLDVPSAASWTPEQRWDLHLRTFECAVYAHILGGVALGVPTENAPGQFDAVALWMPPGRNMDDWLTLLRSGLWWLKWAYPKDGRERFYGEFLPLLNKTKREVLGERDTNSWYLVYLATREEARGRGLARQLIRWGTEQADEKGQATYLESSHLANVPFYQRLGFVIQRRVKLSQGSCAEMDIMVREPGVAKV